ncbi:MAG: ubiquitin-like domain-containing protein [Bellilinea sp.]
MSMPKQRLLIFLSIGLILAGIAIGYIGFEREILLVVDGEPQIVPTRALTLTGVLREAGYTLSPEDEVNPPAGTLMIGKSTARLDRSRTIQLRLYPAGEEITLQSAERIPANLLKQAGIQLFTNDIITRNGLVIDPYASLPDGAGTVTLEFHSAIPVVVQDGQAKYTIYSAADTIIGALAQAGISLSLADRISPPAATALDEPTKVVIERAQPATILLADNTLQIATTADSVGQLLLEAGIPLQGLDYSVPAEDQPLPGSRQVRVVRVQDEIALEQKPIPFKSSYQQDNETELDTSRVITAGEYGIEVSRVRIRLEDGLETERVAEAAWVAKEPQDQLVGYGTQPVVKTIDTPNGTLEYWRAVNVFATSYSPCRLGIPNYCNTQTSSGAQLQKGIVAVTRAWYSWMRGQQVYIPGYGIAVIADVGGGIPGRYWVDLGYTDADFKSWASNVTMYFLTPVPAAIPWILP